MGRKVTWRSWPCGASRCGSVAMTTRRPWPVGPPLRVRRRRAGAGAGAPPCSPDDERICGDELKAPDADALLALRPAGRSLRNTSCARSVEGRRVGSGRVASRRAGPGPSTIRYSTRSLSRSIAVRLRAAT